METINVGIYNQVDCDLITLSLTPDQKKLLEFLAHQEFLVDTVTIHLIEPEIIA